MIRFVAALSLVFAVAFSAGCQSPTDPDDTIDVDDFLEVSTSPTPAIAEAATDGRTYRVVRGNNQPDDILTYDWKTSFNITATLNSQADDDDTLEFPVDLTSITLVVKQASGGIITPPPSGETEYSFPLISQVSSNRFSGINTSVTSAVEVWYDLPNLRKEALITVTMSFRDEDGATFSKSVDVRVAP